MENSSTKIRINEEAKSLAQCLLKIDEKDFVISLKNNKATILGNSEDIYILKKHNNNYEIESKYKSNPYKKRKFKTKKGKILSLRHSRLLATISICFSLAISLGTIKKYADIHDEYQMIEILEENENYSDDILPPEIFISTNQNQKENLKITQNNIKIDLEIQQSSRISKRRETDELYDDTITFYSKRWGIPKELLSALITQERDEKTQNNPGQLTRNICGEKIILPIINKSQEDLQNEKEVDKIYVVREEPKCENYQDEQKYLKQLEIYKEQLEIAKILKEKGYSIVSFSDLLGENNAEKNIAIATAYIAHCNYELNNPILGTFAYNAGYTLTKQAKIDDVMNGMIGLEYTDKKYLQHVFRFLYPNEAANLQFISKKLPENWNEMDSIQRENFLSEKNEEIELNITNITLTQFKEYQYAEEIGNNIRR